MRAGTRFILPVGLTMNRTPMKAVMMDNVWKRLGFSFSRKMAKITAKKGDILLSMDASASTKWSTA